jgi:hypothetical protein
MDCRTFHRNLEDYLEDGFDFAGRFGMERHAQQCIACGKELTNAQRLRQMVSELKAVKAPPDFEAFVINEIGNRKLNARSSAIRQFWIYGLGWPSWRKMAVASSILAVLAVGIFFSLRFAVSDKTDPASPLISEERDVMTTDGVEAKGDTAKSVDQPEQTAPIKVDTPRIVQPAQPARVPEWDLGSEREAAEAEYVEHLTVGSDGRPVTIQLPMPRKIRMQYGQMSEEYFIQNVSH